MSRTSRGPLLFIGGVCLFLAAIFVGIGGSMLLTEHRYRQQGVRTQAVVTGKALRAATADTSTAYEITYRFSQANGQPYTQTGDVTVHQWEGVERGSTITIEYVGGDPSTARVPPANTEEATFVRLMLGVGLILGIVAIAVVTAAFRSRPNAPTDVQTEPPETPLPHAPRMPDADPHRGRSAWQLVRSSLGFWVGGIFLLCGLPFLVMGLVLFYNDWRFAQEARAAEGIVLTKDIRVSSRGSGSRRSRTPHYEVTYRFTADGRTYEGEDELSRSVWQPLREREAVGVFYRPERPRSNRLEPGGQWVLSIVFALLGSIFTAIGGTFFVRSVRHARLESHLRQHGLTTDGTVLALNERNVQINGVQQWRLSYAYQDYQGRHHTGTIDLPEPEAREWTVGATGRVLYDSTKPANAVWIGQD